MKVPINSDRSLTQTTIPLGPFLTSGGAIVSGTITAFSVYTRTGSLRTGNGTLSALGADGCVNYTPGASDPIVASLAVGFGKITATITVSATVYVWSTDIEFCLVSQANAPLLGLLYPGVDLRAGDGNLSGGVMSEALGVGQVSTGPYATSVGNVFQRLQGLISSVNWGRMANTVTISGLPGIYAVLNRTLPLADFSYLQLDGNLIEVPMWQDSSGYYLVLEQETGFWTLANPGTTIALLGLISGTSSGGVVNDGNGYTFPPWSTQLKWIDGFTNVTQTSPTIIRNLPPDNNTNIDSVPFSSLLRAMLAALCSGKTTTAASGANTVLTIYGGDGVTVVATVTYGADGNAISRTIS